MSKTYNLFGKREIGGKRKDEVGLDCLIREKKSKNNLKKIM